MKKSKTPGLRFPQFNGDWTSKEVSQLLNSVSNRVDVNPTTEYQEIGIRSHGKGIFYKDPVVGKKLGNKRVFWIVEEAFILNIVFAWEQAISKTTSKEVGLIASHRFPMYRPKKNAAYLDFIHFFFLTKRGKYLLEMASPGGAGRNKTLGKTRFMELSLRVPNVQEQQKIADFLTIVNQKIQKLKQKRKVLEEYKKGVMQKLFPSADGQAPEIRFKDENGEDFPAWEEYNVGKIMNLIVTNSFSRNDLTYISGEVKNIHYGDIHSEFKIGFKVNEETVPYISEEKNLSKYDEEQYVKPGDLIVADASEDYVDIGKAIEVLETGDEKILAGLHTIHAREKKSLTTVGFKGYLFRSESVRNQLKRISQGATVLGISKGNFIKINVKLPCLAEQQKIVVFLQNIDNNIALVESKIEKFQTFKKGLLQQMFV